MKKNNFAWTYLGFKKKMLVEFNNAMTIEEQLSYIGAALCLLRDEPEKFNLPWEELKSGISVKFKRKHEENIEVEIMEKKGIYEVKANLAKKPTEIMITTPIGKEIIRKDAKRCTRKSTYLKYSSLLRGLESYYTRVYDSNSLKNISEFGKTIEKLENILIGSRGKYENN